MSVNKKLTPTEKIEVAYFHLIRGIEQTDLAAIYKVNAGRISEAVNAVRLAVSLKEPS